MTFTIYSCLASGIIAPIFGLIYFLRKRTESAKVNLLLLSFPLLFVIFVMYPFSQVSFNFSSSDLGASTESTISTKGSFSSCNSTCGINRNKCESLGTSYAICEGGEKMCVKDCCVQYQSSDPMAAAWCR